MSTTLQLQAVTMWIERSTSCRVDMPEATPTAKVAAGFGLGAAFAAVPLQQPSYHQPSVPQPWMGNFGEKLPVMPTDEPCQSCASASPMSTQLLQVCLLVSVESVEATRLLRHGQVALPISLGKNLWQMSNVWHMLWQIRTRLYILNILFTFIGICREGLEWKRANVSTFAPQSPMPAKQAMKQMKLSTMFAAAPLKVQPMDF